ncbi:MAG: hypothetical protein RIC52_14990 [Amphiplicatus sp.]
MSRLLLVTIAQAALIAACSPGGSDAGGEPAAGAKAEAQHKPAATSLFGEPLYAPAPSPAVMAQYEEAKAAYEANPAEADALIWYGRRAGYLGDYAQAIAIFSEGIEKHPGDARMLRHRGHRYISIRKFDEAIADFEKAMTLIEGKPDEIEPDGMPNAQNIPLTTLHGNIRYHLALAHYLKQEWEPARRIFAADLEETQNDDGIVASTHWLYMILRRMGRDDEAAAVLEPITEDMTIIENTYYHRACLFYKGLIPYEEMLPDDVEGVGTAGLVYGFANWHLYNGQQDKAFEIMNRLVDGASWPAFGYIAAEADLAAYDARKK